MGTINLESYNAVIDDVELLNNEPEIYRLGLVFESYGATVFADANGNVSTYYVIVQELLKHLVSGCFNGSVFEGTGEVKTILVTNSLVTENGKDITKLFQSLK